MQRCDFVLLPSDRSLGRSDANGTGKSPEKLKEEGKIDRVVVFAALMCVVGALACDWNWVWRRRRLWRLHCNTTQKQPFAAWPNSFAFSISQSRPFSYASASLAGQLSSPVVRRQDSRVFTWRLRWSFVTQSRPLTALIVLIPSTHEPMARKPTESVYPFSHGQSQPVRPSIDPLRHLRARS